MRGRASFRQPKDFHNNEWLSLIIYQQLWLLHDIFLSAWQSSEISVCRRSIWKQLLIIIKISLRKWCLKIHVWKYFIDIVPVNLYFDWNALQGPHLNWGWVFFFYYFNIYTGDIHHQNVFYNKIHLMICINVINPPAIFVFKIYDMVTVTPLMQVVLSYQPTIFFDPFLFVQAQEIRSAKLNIYLIIGWPTITMKNSYIPLIERQWNLSTIFFLVASTPLLHHTSNMH